MREAILEVTPLPMSEVTMPATEEMMESICALATPAAATATKMVEKRMLI